MTYREKFNETFGKYPLSVTPCGIMDCYKSEKCSSCQYHNNDWSSEYKEPTTYNEHDPVIFKNSLAIYKYDLNGKAVITYLYDDMLINEAVEYKDIKKLGGAKNG